ncbi:MAG TPA: hypothetical protein VFE62_30550 [Gemmataceae bacterium]|nr:hypothetical protein [Gemmataceae bacterium]
MLLDRSNWPAHRPWAIAIVLVTAGAIAWFFFESRDRPDWPGGSSLAGFTFGILGGLIILFEFALWLRKKVRAWPIGSAPAWLRAHLWLGVLSLPLLILHSGLRFGGWLTTVLMLLLIIVVASGVFGLVLQNVVPRRRFDDLPGETIYAQREVLASRLVAAADRQVAALCGAPALGNGQALPAVGEPFLAVGSGRVTEINAPLPTMLAETEPLADFYREQVTPFLLAGASSRSRLADAAESALLFHACKSRLPADAHALVDMLERYCQERRLWDRQVRLHFWLHCWLWVHFPLSIALVILMFVHAFVAIRYW